MRKPASWVALERLGRERLSRHVTMRDVLFSEVAAMHGLRNLPDDPELALAAGRRLAQDLLKPLIETFGPVDLRSGYRSVALNDLGSGLRPQRMAATAKNYAGHVWDRRDGAGRMGACVTVVIPWFAAHYTAGRDWRDLGWWLWDHLDFHEVYFFPVNAAFNLTWREAPERRVLSYIAPKGYLVGDGRVPDPQRAERHADFPAFRGIAYPPIPG
jgi:hypothetical protein